MPNIDTFIEETVRDLRRRLSQADSSMRRGIEDGLALLTDYRLAGIDETRFERMLATMRGGRSPVWMQSLRPETVADDLAVRWQQYRHEAAAAAN